MRQLFLDCDGVLADFDIYAESIFGMPPRQAEEQLGSEAFWDTLTAHDGFYEKLPLMADALELYDAVKHLNPIILTGQPLGDWARPQKLAWAARHFPSVEMIVCRSAEKRAHMKPGDVLVDDWPKYKHLWEEAGGIFILHTNAKQSIAEIEGVFADDSTTKNCELVREGSGKMAKALETPDFQSEAEEAQWWEQNEDLILREFEASAKDGTLGRGTLARRVGLAATSEASTTPSTDPTR